MYGYSPFYTNLSPTTVTKGYRFTSPFLKGPEHGPITSRMSRISTVNIQQTCLAFLVQYGQEDNPYPPLSKPF